MDFKLITLCALVAFSQTTTARCIRTGFTNIGLAGAGFDHLGLGLGLIGNGWAPNGLFGNGLAANGLFGNGLAANGLFGNGLAANDLFGNGLAANGLFGGGLLVTSASPIAPTGLAVLAENLELAGPVSVGGELPLLAAVALEGQVPADGQADVNYSCDNGNIGILRETVIASRPVVSSDFGLGTSLGRGVVGGLRSSGCRAGSRFPRRQCGAF